MSTKITRTPINHISDELLEKLLLALHPVGFTNESDRYDIGYFNAQRDFRAVLESRLNTGPLPEAEPKVVPLTELELPTNRRSRWFK